MNALVDTLLRFAAESPILERLLIATVEFTVLAAIVSGIVYIGRLRSPRVVALLWVVIMAKPLASVTIGAPASIVHGQRGEWYNLTQRMVVHARRRRELRRTGTADSAGLLQPPDTS